MSSTAERTITKTDNKPPIELPNEAAMLENLQAQYPEIDKRLKEWEGAFAEFPLDIPLEQADVAQSLQDLLGQVKKDSKVWTDSFQKQEKKPLNALIKVVGNFFTSRVEKADGFLAKYGPVHETFLQRKAERARKDAEEEADRQREAEQAARAAAEQARRDQEAAEARAADERRKEQEAREAAERARVEREEADARAAAAKERERQEAEARRTREKAEKEQNATALREIRPLLAEAEKLHNLAEADEASDTETARLAELTRPGGLIGELARPVSASLLLDADQVERVGAVRKRLGELREAGEARLGKRQRAAAEKARKAEEERQAQDSAVREAQRNADEERAATARREREEAEAAAQRARDDRAVAEQAARDARDAARAEEGSAKDAGKVAKGHDTEADRNANRADRIDNRLEKSTEADLSRTRGDLGTVGSLAKSWGHMIVDEDALREALRKAIKVPAYVTLVDQLTSDALNGAVYRFMRLHQDGWRGRDRVEDALAGVVFSYDTAGRIV